MVVTLATMPYELNVNRVVHLAKENLTCEVRPSYVSGDENNQYSVENRITLIVEDTKSSFWPWIVRMNTRFRHQRSLPFTVELRQLANPT